MTTMMMVPHLLPEEEVSSSIMKMEATSSSLNDRSSSSKTDSHHTGWTSSDDDSDTMDQDSDSEMRRSFREHREDHYDEFLTIQELRQKGSHLEDSDEESSMSAGVKDMDIKNSSLPANGS